MTAFAMARIDDAVTSQTAEVDRAYGKIEQLIVPFLCIGFMAAYVDRANVGFAKLQMLSDLRMSETVFGLGAGLFFLGYILCEAPNNLLLIRVGPRTWIARIMLTWGLLSGLMTVVHGPLAFYAVRFLLGVAEAGFMPGVLYYLTEWFPAVRLLGAIDGALLLGLYTIAFWFPTLLRDAGMHNALLTAAPHAAAVVAMLVNGWHSDRTCERRWHIILPILIVAAALGLSPLAHRNIVWTVAIISIANAGILGALPPFWTLPSVLLRGAAAAAGLALAGSIAILVVSALAVFAIPRGPATGQGR